MSGNRTDKIARIFADGRRIDAAVRLAAADAVREHKKQNLPLVIWRDGRIAWVPADELTRTIVSKAARKKKPARKRSR